MNCPVRAAQRVSTHFAEGQYQLSKGSVRAFCRVPARFNKALIHAKMGDATCTAYAKSYSYLATHVPLI